MAPPQPDPTHIFVYGTLRTAYTRLPASVQTIKPPQLLQSGDRWKGTAKLRGHHLYDIGEYPGVVPVNKTNFPSATVTGDVFKIDKSDLPLLDDYEMIGGRFKKPYEYRRVAVHVDLIRNDNTESMFVWLYIYNWPILSNAVLIENGDFIDEYVRRISGGQAQLTESDN